MNQLGALDRLGRVLDMSALTTLPWPVLLVVGVALLLFGWRLYIVLLAGIWFVLTLKVWPEASRFISHAFGKPVPDVPALIQVAIALGTALVAIAWSRYAVFLLGAMASCMLVAAPASMFPDVHTRFFLLVVSFLIGGGLAVVLLRPAVVTLLSLAGAQLLVMGAVEALAQLTSSVWHRPFRPPQWAVAIAFVILVALGLFYQFTSREPQQDESAQ